LCEYRSEVELEEILTVYTRMSRSASVFLRSGSRLETTPSVNSACGSPVKGQGHGEGQDAASPSGKPKSNESRVKHSSADKHEGSRLV